jgi:hypothetical protein
MTKTARLAIIFLLIFSMLGSANAVDTSRQKPDVWEPGGPSPKGSDYISSYSSYMANTGNTVVIYYSIYGSGKQAEIGATQIEIYRYNSNGTGTFLNIWRSTNNSSLYSYNAYSHNSYVTYTGQPGTSYYAKVTFFAGDGTNSDSRTVTTGVFTL